MSDDKNVQFTVKAMINKEKTRVLFAEVDNNFADILLRFSTLPLGLVVRALLMHFGDKMPVIGCLNNLYKDFKKLNHNVDVLHSSYNLHKNSDFRGFPSGEEMYTMYQLKCSLEKDYFCFLNIFSLNSSFTILDDLRIVDNGKGSFLANIDNVGIAVADMDSVETRDVTIGVNEVMDFLLRLLISRRPLNDIILGTPVNSDMSKIKPEPVGIPLHNLEKNSASSDDKMMVLKLTLQKSTNKLLFAQADHVFVNYLFSVLLIPLGRVDCRLGGDTGVKNIDNLLTSIIDYTPKYLSNFEIESTKFTYNNYFNGGRYMVSDDLSVTRSSLVSGVSVLDELKISLSDVKEVDLQIGVDEVLSILKASLTSTRALTDGLLIPRLLKKQLTPKQES